MRKLCLLFCYILCYFLDSVYIFVDLNTSPKLGRWWLGDLGKKRG